MTSTQGDMMTSNAIRKFGVGVATAAAVALIAFSAQAQTGNTGAATTAPKAPTIAKTPAAPPAPAGKTEVKTPVAAKKTEVKKAAAKGPSVCVNLEQAACSANTSCRWMGVVKRKDGREIKAHCRLDTSKKK